MSGRVNGAQTNLIFDTGASNVTLSAGDAARAGLDTAGLSFNTQITTADGPAVVADVRLDEIAVGPILERNLSAHVARPGALKESLLGMNFLGRLKNYAVEGDRLILTPKPSTEQKRVLAPEASTETAAGWPRYEIPLPAGEIEVTIENRLTVPVTVGIRRGMQGADVALNAGATRPLWLEPGSADVLWRATDSPTTIMRRTIAVEQELRVPIGP